MRKVEGRRQTAEGLTDEGGPGWYRVTLDLAVREGVKEVVSYHLYASNHEAAVQAGKLALMEKRGPRVVSNVIGITTEKAEGRRMKAEGLNGRRAS